MVMVVVKRDLEHWHGQDAKGPGVNSDARAAALISCRSSNIWRRSSPADQAISLCVLCIISSLYTLHSIHRCDQLIPQMQSRCLR